MSEVYFDAAAAMPITVNNAERLAGLTCKYAANQEAVHGGALLVRKALADCAEELKRTYGTLKVQEVIWGNSASELCNVLTHIPLNADSEVITTQAEHPALIANLKRLAGSGVYREAAYGIQGLTKAALEKVVSPQSSIVAFHAVQSEVGLITPGEELITVIRQIAPKAMIVVDAVQAAGKVSLEAWRKADCLIIGGHKLGSAGGAAFLALNKSTAKLLQAAAKVYRDGYYGGRLEAAPLMLFSQVAKEREELLSANYAYVSHINDYLRNSLAELGALDAIRKKCQIHFTVAENSDSSAYILHITLKGMQSAVIARMLSETGVWVGTGSACQAESAKPSIILTSMGYNYSEAFAGLRISLSEQNTIAEADKLLDALQEALKNY